MSLVTQISALATQIGATIKALTTRVTTLESRATVVILTQAAYDALTPDSGTLYVIVG